MAFKDTADQHVICIRAGVRLPRGQQYLQSPRSWRDEVLYFLLVDRFSDEKTRPLLDRSDLAAARPAGWQWESWWRSGRDRWQGGTIRGVASRLGYLEDLGVTALWLSPVFKQRAHLDTYHGYGIQDFLDVDPRFGTRRDLVDLVDAAHARGMRIILDVIFNHSGANWVYPDGVRKMPYTTSRYGFGSWLGRQGGEVDPITKPDDGAWPVELQDADAYTRAGSANLAEGTDVSVVLAEHKRGDFEDLRDFDLGHPGLLDDLARCYKYWIALTGCDGFRIDTVKHVTFDDARNFCGAIREYALTLGIDDFFLVGEVAGGESNAARYLEAVGRNLNAALDIGAARPALTAVAKGLRAPGAYFDALTPHVDALGSHRVLGDRHVSILDDHDHVFGTKLRFSAGASPQDRQVAVGVALQLFSLGIPCIYYGTEQAFAGPEPAEQQWLNSWGGHDEYLREAMFGPEHPLAGGVAGLDGTLDPHLPGFGPFGTSGAHCFDPDSAAFVRIKALLAVRRAHAVLRHGRQYERETRSGDDFRRSAAGEALAWSRILDLDEAVCIASPCASGLMDVDVTVDAALNAGPRSTFTVVANTAAFSEDGAVAGLAVGDQLPVHRDGGRAYVSLHGLGPSEVVVLVSRPLPEDGAVGS
jgi:glycosidase